MAPFLSGQSETIHGDDVVMGWELFGRRGIIKGGWKLVWMFAPYGPERWEMYDLSNDPTESTDLSADNPDKLAELLSAWEDYVDENDVIIPAVDRGYGLIDAAR